MAEVLRPEGAALFLKNCHIFPVTRFLPSHLPIQIRWTENFTGHKISYNINHFPHLVISNHTIKCITEHNQIFYEKVQNVTVL